MEYEFTVDWRGVLNGETVRRFPGDRLTLAAGDVSPLALSGVIVPVETPAPAPEPPGGPGQLAKMLKSELVALAEVAGIASPNSLTKAELVAALEAAQEGEHGTGS